MWNKEGEYDLILIFQILLFDSAVQLLNWLNNNVRFGVGSSTNILLSFVYVPTEDSFI